METKKHGRRDRMQNLLIVLLSVSAVLLFAQTQMINLDLSWSDGRFSSWLNPTVSPGTPDVTTLADLAAPVHVVVSGRDGRCGLFYTTTANASLSRMSTLLGSALGSAGTWTECGDDSFRAALNHGVYFDFLGDLPLSLLAELLGTDNAGAAQLSARQVVLFPGEENVRLYIRDENGGCRTCSTAVRSPVLSTELAPYRANGAFFAFEGGEAFEGLDPYTPLTGESFSYPVLSAASSLSDSTALLRQLDFNPYTNSRYLGKGGTEVIVGSSSRTLRLETDGTVVYSAADGDDTLSVPSSGDAVTASEAVLGTRSLAEAILSGQLGEAALYLEEISAAEDGWLVRFGFHLNGMPVRFFDGSCGAEFSLTGSAVSRLTLRFRQYSSTAEVSPLLPLTQAVAVLAQEWPGARLTAAYVDAGGSSASLSWLAD